MLRLSECLHLRCHNVSLDKPPEGYFNAIYMGKVVSDYKDEVSFQSVSQASVVSRCLPDPDAMYEASCLLAENDAYRLFETNPLHMGFFLDHIVSGNKLRIKTSRLIQQCQSCQIKIV